MNDTDYKAVLQRAKDDLLKEQQALGQCYRQQEAHEKKILGLRATIAALSRMLDEEFIEEDAMGLTDAIREVFRSLGQGNLIPTEVRSRLEMLGYDTSKYGNVMASVHTIVNRLVSQGEIRQVSMRGDKPCYQGMPKLMTPKLSDMHVGPPKLRDAAAPKPTFDMPGEGQSLESSSEPPQLDSRMFRPGTTTSAKKK
jgi:hypothetical protein